MAEPNSIENNMEKGMVVQKDKKPFRVVGLTKDDRNHYEFTGEEDKRRPGRPSKDQNWKTVGPQTKTK